MMTSKIAITMGDPCGIGPEVILKALNSKEIDSKRFLLIGNQKIFNDAATFLNLKMPYGIDFYNLDCDFDNICIGHSGKESGRISFECLKKACDMANEGLVSSIVTAPLSKHAINMAGYCYSGQTEVLQKYLAKGDLNKAEMLFVSKDMRVLLLTRHIQLCKVSNAICHENIILSILALYKSLIRDFGIEKPNIAICGLNPHAGEAGLLGDEENDVIIPVINKLKKEYNVNIEGPFPADTIWVESGRNYFDNKKQKYDAYIACYHDQGLIPIKLIAMDSTVNTTINLPIIRTSPSHGTAYDIAGKGVANYNSMLKAIEVAEELTSKRIN